jgi:hypothetical protein
MTLVKIYTFQNKKGAKHISLDTEIDTPDEVEYIKVDGIMVFNRRLRENDNGTTRRL